MTLYDWPRAAAFGRVIPKNKIYAHATASNALKDLFVREVDQIVWTHKLAPETINLAATKSVAEIQVFRVVQREPVLSHEVLRAIDKAIPFPLLFELAHDGKIKLAATFKRPNTVDSTKWVLGDYFESDWLPEVVARTPLPVALNMGALYEQLLGPLVQGQMARLAPVAVEVTLGSSSADATAETISLENRIAQAEAIKVKTREIDKIQAQLTREKQFNKRVAINAELRAAKQELGRLGAAIPGGASMKDQENEYG